MRSWFFIVLLAAYSTLAGAQSISVGYHQTISVPVGGALAAFSLNDLLADAQAESGTVTIFGKNPGSARIVVVTQDGSKTIEVLVIPPPPSYPPGFVRPLSGEAAMESGSFQSRFSSGPAQSENTLDFMRRQGDRSLHFHMTGLILLNPDPQLGTFALSSIFYQILTPHRDITILDQLVINSPLTVDGSVVRGFHLRQGAFLFHAGYSSTTTFDNLILPLQKQGVLGVGYQFPMGRHAVLTPNFYFFQGNRFLSQDVAGGTVASLVYDYEPGANLGLLAEVGFSHGVGAAVKFRFNGARNQFNASLRYEPLHFASLSSNSLHGFYTNFDWTRSLTNRLTAGFRLADSHYNLSTFNLTNVAANGYLQWQLSPRWSLMSGFNYGRSQPHFPPGPTISVQGIPLGLNFDSRRFQSGFLYQYSRDSSSVLRSDEFRITMGTHWRGFSWNGYADRQTRALTIDFVLAGVPSLRQALDELAISATTSDQIAQALSQGAGLLNQGLISGIGINLIPVRTQASSNLTWSHARQRFNFRLLYNRNQLLQGENRTTIATFSYSLKFKRVNEFYSSISLIGDGSGRNHPLFQVSLRREIRSAPNFIIPRRRGFIGGVVFADDGATGEYRAGSPPLADVEVILDHARRTRTGRDGHYRFTGVSYGSHSLEAVFHSPKPFFFTTASSVQSEVDKEVNFGVGLSLARLFGSVRSDSGSGILGVEIHISHQARQIRAHTGSDGEFRLEGLSSGDYEIKINANSVPPGYSVAELKPALAVVEPSTPARVAFILKAVRNIAGRVLIYDRVSGREIPVANTVVLLRELSREATTDADGAYLFRDLPAGSYSLKVSYQGSDTTKAVTLPDSPAFLKNIDINVAAK